LHILQEFRELGSQGTFSDEHVFVFSDVKGMNGFPTSGAELFFVIDW
jgi:hypothetical protein